jgi:hypothetical protein
MNETPGALAPGVLRYYDVLMANNKGKAVKSSIGVLGALATIISVWWFALRPRRNKGDS